MEESEGGTKHDNNSYNMTKYDNEKFIYEYKSLSKSKFCLKIL